MKTRAESRGLALIEVLLVLAMAGVLAAISVPKYFQARKQARQSEVVSDLKRLHVGMSTQRTKPATSIHVPGFQPKRGNRYSYHLAEPCTMIEDRSTRKATPHPDDDCIGVDTFAHPTLPSTFTPMPIAGAVWGENAQPGLGTAPGIFGSDTSWAYLAYAAGDVDDDPTDAADTWMIASADGEIWTLCPAPPEGFTLVPAGEPFQIHDDTLCSGPWGF